MGTLAAITPTDAGQRLVIDTSNWTPEGGYMPELGHSICISGVCLTVANIDGQQLGFDVIPETLRFTTLGEKSVGDRVNLEPSLLPNQPMGGHFVQGHIDGVGKVIQVVTEGEWRTRIVVPDDLRPFMVPKGSVTIDGVSLTIAAVDDESEWFEVALIPTTLQLTTLGTTQVGGRVNLESDILTRTVVHTLQNMQSG